jgi:hypothetical protein
MSKPFLVRGIELGDWIQLDECWILRTDTLSQGLIYPKMKGYSKYNDPIYSLKSRLFNNAIGFTVIGQPRIFGSDFKEVLDIWNDLNIVLSSTDMTKNKKIIEDFAEIIKDFK